MPGIALLAWRVSHVFLLCIFAMYIVVREAWYLPFLLHQRYVSGFSSIPHISWYVISCEKVSIAAFTTAIFIIFSSVCLLGDFITDYQYIQWWQGFYQHFHAITDYREADHHREKRRRQEARRMRVAQVVRRGGIEARHCTPHVTAPATPADQRLTERLPPSMSRTKIMTSRNDTDGVKMVCVRGTG